MAIDALPSPPLRSDPLNFAQKAENFMNALPKFADQANALESSIIAATNTATSSTSLTLSTGSKSLTASTGKSFGVNSRVTFVSTSDQSKAMNGLVQDYNPSTGAMTFNAEYVIGSGSASDWFIYYSSPQTILTQQANVATLGANTFTGPQTLPGDATSNLHAVPKQQLDTGLSGKANLSGSSSQAFNVGTPTTSTHALNKEAFSASGAAPVFAARAWVLLDMTRDASGAVSSANTNRFIYASGGVSSVLRINSSSFEVNFSTPLTQNGYAPLGMTLHEPGVYAGLVAAQAISGTFPANKCLFSLHKSTDATAITPGLISVVFFGN